MNKSEFGKNSPKILKSPDQNKDQSYFLWQIKKKDLNKILFPIGDFENKSAVREFAIQNNLITATKKDSQGLCFVGQTNVKQMLWQILGQKVGLILTISEEYKLESELGFEVKNKKFEKLESDNSNNLLNSKTELKNQIQKPKIIKSQKTLAKIVSQIESKSQSKSNLEKTIKRQNSTSNNQNINFIEYKILKNLTKEIIEKLVELKKYFVIAKTENGKNKTKIDSDLEMQKPENKSWDKNDKISESQNENPKLENAEKTKICTKFYQILNLHSGAFVYTIGQRQGLNLSGGPWFVSLIDITANTVFVSSEKMAKEEIYTKKILVKNLNWQNLPDFN